MCDALKNCPAPQIIKIYPPIVVNFSELFRSPHLAFVPFLHSLPNFALTLFVHHSPQLCFVPIVTCISWGSFFTKRVIRCSSSSASTKKKHICKSPDVAPTGTLAYMFFLFLLLPLSSLAAALSALLFVYPSASLQHSQKASRPPLLIVCRALSGGGCC